MKVHIRYHDVNAVHTRVTVFIDGANCGTLCINTKDDFAFQSIIQKGCHPTLDEFRVSGRPWPREVRDAKPAPPL